MFGRKIFCKQGDMFLGPDKHKNIVNIPSVEDWCVGQGTIVNPGLLMMTKKGVGHIWPQWGSHGHAILLPVIVSIKIKSSTFGCYPQQSTKVFFRDTVKKILGDTP